MSVHRLLLVYTPLSTSFRSKKTAWLIILIVNVVSFAANGWVIQYFKIQARHDTKPYCDVNKSYHATYFLIAAIFTFVVVLVPVFAIIVLNAMIILKTNENETKRRKELQSNVSRQYTNNNNNEARQSNSISTRTKRYTSVIDIKIKQFYSNTDQEINNIRQSTEQASRKLRKLLIMISITYAMFNLPYMVVWLFYFHSVYFEDLNENAENYLMAFLQLTEILAVFNYSSKFYIFCYSGTKFRRQLRHSSKLSV